KTKNKITITKATFEALGKFKKAGVKRTEAKSVDVAPGIPAKNEVKNDVKAEVVNEIKKEPAKKKTSSAKIKR
ncbi:hypothetical protein KKC87_01215, partial [Patescibacteria group bacterium]|nr:hypothetical protein [Patescibacteria group bacterium]